MVKINGIEAKNNNEAFEDIKPSIKEIIERMDNNYHARQLSTMNTQYNNSILKQTAASENLNDSPSFSDNDFENNTYQNNSNDNSNLLLSLIPLLFTKDKNNLPNFKNGAQIILKEILKKTNNPLLTKILEILPKISNKDTENSSSTQKHETKEDNKKIDDFVKTDEYQNNNIN